MGLSFIQLLANFSPQKKHNTRGGSEHVQVNPIQMKTLETQFSTVQFSEFKKYIILSTPCSTPKYPQGYACSHLRTSDLDNVDMKRALEFRYFSLLNRANVPLPKCHGQCNGKNLFSHSVSLYLLECDCFRNTLWECVQRLYFTPQWDRDRVIKAWPRTPLYDTLRSFNRQITIWLTKFKSLFYWGTERHSES